MPEEIKKMTDEEATPFDWWLLNYLREELFSPGPNDKKVVSPEPAATQGA